MHGNLAGASSSPTSAQTPALACCCIVPQLSTWGTCAPSKISGYISAAGHTCSQDSGLTHSSGPHVQASQGPLAHRSTSVVSPLVISGHTVSFVLWVLHMCIFIISNIQNEVKTVLTGKLNVHSYHNTAGCIPW